MKRFVAALALVLAATVTSAQIPDTFTVNADYVSGQPGFKKRIWDGVLVLDDQSVSYWQKRPTRLVFTRKEVPKFSIPFAIVKKVSNMIDTNGIPGIGRKNQEEYVFVTTETEKSAEVVIFKVKNNTSAAVAAKIQFAMKRAAGVTEAKP